ncbi:protein FAM110A isoform X3 [Pyrgilauda ruficollis]|uniref:protein FAM110A isoform X3 n=1 Tax=Pyrgilauda ruficollis TaxID=221976 RepID=UPI001B861F08|nr:protein FAM110A isoform X3 [Pyrgilauda ruficollis]
MTQLAWRNALWFPSHVSADLPRRASSPGADSAAAAACRTAPAPSSRHHAGTPGGRGWGAGGWGQQDTVGTPSEREQGEEGWQLIRAEEANPADGARAPRCPWRPLTRVPVPARRMPVEALQAGDTMKGVTVTAPFTSAMPVRILRKGPAYFRRHAEPGAGKPSAVERLEADKAKYVKSQKVASTKQEPVKPLLLKQPLFTPGVRRAVLTPSRRAPPGPRRADAASPKTSLDLEILNNLINLCDSPFPKAESPLGRECRWRAEAPAVEGAVKPPESPAATKPPGSVAVRRVDVRPCAAPRSPVTPLPASPMPGGLPVTPSRSSPARPESARRQPLLHRSKSDLSDRLSRATADLERFFNYCGLDPEEMQDMGAERFARASSDIVSLKFHSVSTASSEGGRSPPSAATPEGRPAERVPYGISIIERNARVIKWLYGLRQAREPQQVSDV